MIRGNLPSECATAVRADRAVLEALGKKQGLQNDRGGGQRFHDALRLACELLPRVDSSSTRRAGYCWMSR